MHQSVLKHLASIWVAWSCGLTDPAAALAEMPEQDLLDTVEEAERFHPDDLGALLSLVRHDPRVRVRSHIAGLSGALWLAPPSATEPILAALCRDASARVRSAAARGLGRLLEVSSPARRVEIVSAWASAEDPHRRATVARALSSATPMFITDLVIEQLAGDASLEVRCAALETAAQHVAENPSRYAAIAQAHAADSDPRVRDAARRVLARR